jgi:hypothetical protein
MTRAGDVVSPDATVGIRIHGAHDVEFLAFISTPSDADASAMRFVADRAAGDPLVGVETRPCHRGGIDLQLVRRMMLARDAVTAFERLFRQRAQAHGGTLDGWGVRPA